MKNYVYTYDNYIFDLYGTLVDILTDEQAPSFWAKIGKLLAGDSKQVKDDYNALCKKYQDELGENGEIELLNVFEDLINKYNSKLSKQELAWKFRKASIKKERLFPNVKKSLKNLRKNGKGVYLISNAQECFTMKELKKLGLLKYFDGIVISSQIGFKKPSYEIFDLAFKKFGLTKEGCLYSGNDPKDDIQGAENFGIQAHFVVHSH